MTDQINKIPIWFWVVSIVMLLWNIMGIGSFYMHSFISDEALQALPEAERALYGEYPMWTTVVFAIATFFGLIGCVGLVTKKAWSMRFFMVSLVAVLVQMWYSLFRTSSVDVYGNTAYYMPVLVIVVAIFLVWFSGFGIKKTWLS